ncbi:deleted in malignant brain tumors 1 protein-like [Paramacrobiotus metropolitanus]|uniref:deleted in malignant brain tumors 1 protein-like n=1 Tax=Paramacrobiotus metropolitanus TaxID=2943436 RepID=UPI002445AB94|nr:deleted in malignant brain tumors 1 protein-like [Paramacrobiotus metropolitanus]
MEWLPRRREGLGWLALIIVSVGYLSLAGCQTLNAAASVNVTIIPDLFYCPKGWVLLDWMCYRYMETNASWSVAGEACRRIGSDLLTMSDYSSPTNAWISGQLPNTSVWLAAALTPARTLSWSDGQEIGPYSGLWAIGQPDAGGGECVALDGRFDTDNWYLAACETLLPFVCQQPACPKDTFTCPGEKKCLLMDRVCDHEGNVECGSWADEFDCPPGNGRTEAPVCAHYLTGASGSLSSPNHPGPYPRVASCLWLIETPAGTRVDLQFSEFATEANQDTVSVLSGSPLPARARALAVLSGQPAPTALHYTADNNFLILRLTADASVEMAGFRATYKALNARCGGDVQATVGWQRVAVMEVCVPLPGGRRECRQFGGGRVDRRGCGKSARWR